MLLLLALCDPSHAGDPPPAESEAEETSEAQPESSSDPGPEAQAAFERAEAAFADGSYGDAARLFEQADQLAPHASVIFNAAVAWDHAGDSPRAASAYKRALEREGLSRDQAAQSEKRLSELSARLVYVHLAKPLGVTVSVAHVRNEVIPARFFLEPGEYEVLLEDGDKRRTDTIKVVRGRQSRFEFEPLKDNAPPPPPPPPPDVKDSVPSKTQETLGWVLLGAGVVGAGVATYFGTQALDAQDKAMRENTSSGGLGSTQETHDLAERLQLQTNIAWGGAGLLGATGVVLLLTSPTIEF